MLSTLLGITMLASACSGSPTATPDEATENPATETGTTDEGGGAETLSITFQPATESMAVLTQLVAFAGDYFDEVGLDVTYNPPIPNAAQAAQSVTGSDADIAIVGSTGSVAAVSAGRDVVGVATLTKGPTTQLALRNDVIETLGVSPDDSIEERVQALAGLTLGLPTPGSSTDVVTRQTLVEYGVNPDTDLTVRPISDTAALVTALREGQVDGIAFSAPVSVQGVAEGYSSVWFSLAAGDVPLYETMPFIDVVTSSEYLETNREAVRRFVAALDAASRDLIEDTDAVSMRVKERWFADLDQTTYDLAFDVTAPAAQRGIVPTPDSFQVLLDTVNATSDEDLNVAFDDVYDTTIVEEVGAQ